MLEITKSEFKELTESYPTRQLFAPDGRPLGSYLIEVGKGEEWTIRATETGYYWVCDA